MKAGNAIKVYTSILPHPQASKFTENVILYHELVKDIHSLDPEVDIMGVIDNVQRVLDKSISTRLYEIEGPGKQLIDLGRINFEKLCRQLERKKSNRNIELLKNILSFKLKEMILV